MFELQSFLKLKAFQKTEQNFRYRSSKKVLELSLFFKKLSLSFVKYLNL